MKSRKIAALLVGAALTFSICATGCAGKEAGAESLSGSTERGGTAI